MIYNIATGKRASLPASFRYRAQRGIEPELLCRSDVADDQATSFSYWSHRDPNRLRTIDFLDWRIERQYSTLFVFSHASNSDRLIWIWGSASAVRIADLGAAQLHYCPGAVFLVVPHKGRPANSTLHVVPLSPERADDGLPPATLPRDAPLVTPRSVHQGRAHSFLKVVGAEGAAPLVTTEGTEGRKLDLWLVT